MTKLQTVVVTIASIGLLVGGLMLIKIAYNYKVAVSEYSDISDKYTKEHDESLEVAPEEEIEPVKELARNYNRDDFPDISVDFENLMSVNPNTVGWLYVGATDISYPIVQGTDNEEYLHVTFEGTKNASGSIFMDWDVNKDLTSCNTFIYGHNMKNMSMFGSLKKILWDDSLRVKNPYIYIFLPGYIYRYEIFSYYLDSVDSKMYYICDTKEEYTTYINTALSMSQVDCQVNASDEENIVTLVTCSGTGSNKKRMFVHGTFVDRYIFE